ncbi:hypothetical protein GCM10009665_59210 [Kitasatospora nipponensis]|uniref:Uncharacterized protein n=1 Tax=Kitasatospora nipponensis TaxID=258049 RepID=A0ABN1WUT1_9ACTN
MGAPVRGELAQPVASAATVTRTRAPALAPGRRFGSRRNGLSDSGSSQGVWGWWQGLGDGGRGVGGGGGGGAGGGGGGGGGGGHPPRAGQRQG